MLTRLLLSFSLMLSLTPNFISSGGGVAWGSENPPPGVFLKTSEVEVTEGVTTSFEVVQIPVTTEDQQGLSDAKAWLNQDLAEAKKVDPQIEPRFILAKDFSDPTVGNRIEAFSFGIQARPKVEALPPKWTRGMRGKIANWTLDHSRGLFTLVRGTANGAVFSWTLMVSTQIPAEVALPVGLVVGCLNSGFYYVEKGFQQMLVKFKKKNKVSEPLPVDKPTLVRRQTLAEFREQMKKRIYKISLMTLARVGLFSLGAGSDLTGGLSSVAVRAVTSGGYSAAGQAFWDLDISHQATKLSRENPADAKRFQLVAELKKTALTTLSLGLSVAYFQGVPMADAGLLVLGAAGAGRYLIHTYQEWKREKALVLEDWAEECRRLVRHPFDDAAHP